MIYTSNFIDVVHDLVFDNGIHAGLFNPNMWPCSLSQVSV